MANEFKIKNGFFSEGSSNITGSLNVSAGITGSLLGTSSYATSTAAVAGTANYIPKFATSTTLGNSVIFESGSNIGIGTSIPLQKIHINDTAFIGDNLNGGSGILIYGTNTSKIDFNFEGISTGYIQCGEEGSLHLEASSRAIELSIDFITKLEVSLDGNVGIGTTGGTIDPSALLEVKSTTQGFLPPRMSEGERNSIPSPALGLMIFNLSSDEVNVYTGAGWRKIAYV
jgi:hypothetical protein